MVSFMKVTKEQRTQYLNTNINITMLLVTLHDSEFKCSNHELSHIELELHQSF